MNLYTSRFIIHLFASFIICQYREWLNFKSASKKIVLEVSINLSLISCQKKYYNDMANDIYLELSKPLEQNILQTLDKHVHKLHMVGQKK